MSWQDIVLSIGQWVFIFALFPFLFNKEKPSLMTSVPNGIVLFLFVAVYFSLHYWLSLASTFISVVVWIVLAVQKYLQNK